MEFECGTSRLFMPAPPNYYYKNSETAQGAGRGVAATQEMLQIFIGVMGLFLFFLAIGYLGALDRERRAVRRSHP